MDCIPLLYFLSLFCLQHVYIIINQIFNYEGETILKKSVIVIVTVLISVSAFVMLANMEIDRSSAQTIISGQCGSNATYNICADGTLEITGSGEMYQYDTTPAPWHECRDDIDKIVINDKITKLGASAFLDCKNVTELSMPITLNSVVSDKFPAFAGCSCIEKINFTRGNGEYGYNYAAYEGTNSWYQNTPWYQSRGTLKEITFADDVKGIGSDAFRELNITSVVLPDSVVHLGNHCFFNCTKLTDLTLPMSLNSFGSNEKYPAFNGCMAVQKVTFTKGNGVPFDYSVFTGLGISPYYWKLAPWNMNPDVAKTIIIADDIPVIGNFMFYDCNIKELSIPYIYLDLGSCYVPFVPNEDWSSYCHLEKVTITKGVGTGGDYCQATCKKCPWNLAPNLKTVIIEDDVTRIGSYTFSDCNIENLTLPNTLVSFGKHAFDTCTIKNLTLPINVNATWLDEEPAFNNVSGIEKINFTPGSGYGFMYAAYKGSNCWYQLTPWYQCRDTLKEINFAEGIKRIGSDAFRELNITSMVIPNSVESLGCHAFYKMTRLSSLTIPITLDSVGSTKYPSFDQVKNLTELRLTAGTNGVGQDYTDKTPFWNYPYNNGFIITFDSGIDYIGTNTFTTYKFADRDNQPLEPTASNLSGHRFQGASSQTLYQISDLPDHTNPYSVAKLDSDMMTLSKSVA